MPPTLSPARATLGGMRADPPSSGSDLVLLTGFLDFLRETLLLKCEGLSAEQLARPLPPSSLTLGGLLNHLSLVEDGWFRYAFLGVPRSAPWEGVDWDADPEFEFRTAADLSPGELRQRYRETAARSRQVVAEAESLDQLSVRTGGDGQPWSLRWILIHLIEETARHAGHADLLREAVDGTVGE
jgi:uncharacterized damage-inducible protein DinB